MFRLRPINHLSFRRWRSVLAAKLDGRRLCEAEIKHGETGDEDDGDGAGKTALKPTSRTQRRWSVGVFAFEKSLENPRHPTSVC